MTGADRNITVGKSWPRAATPCDLVPNWEGEFCSFSDWVNFAPKRLTVAYDSNGSQLKAICVDTLGRRCANGGDFARARDEGTFPVRYFFECVEPTRDDRVKRRYADIAGAKERLATFPPEVRQRLHDWQTTQREWFDETVLEIVAEFIASDDKRRQSAPSDDLVERVAKAIRNSFLTDEDSCAYVGNNEPLDNTVVDGGVDLLRAARTALSVIPTAPGTEQPDAQDQVQP